LKLGLEKVPVHVAVGLTPAQAKASRRDCLKIGMNISASRTSHRLTGQLLWRERSQPDYPGSRRTYMGAHKWCSGMRQAVLDIVEQIGWLWLLYALA
jgi:hypothetical protein